jgi:hypothetical protein
MTQVPPMDESVTSIYPQRGFSAVTEGSYFIPIESSRMLYDVVCPNLVL